MRAKQSVTKKTRHISSTQELLILMHELARKGESCFSCLT